METAEITLSELVAIKEALESSILRDVQGRVRAFKNRHSIGVKAIELQMVETTTFDSKLPLFECVGCKIKLAIDI